MVCWPFIWTNMTPLYPRMLCAKWFWRIRWRYRKLTDGQTDERRSKKLTKRGEESVSETYMYVCIASTGAKLLNTVFYQLCIYHTISSSRTNTNRINFSGIYFEFSAISLLGMNRRTVWPCNLNVSISIINLSTEKMSASEMFFSRELNEKTNFIWNSHGKKPFGKLMWNTFLVKFICGDFTCIRQPTRSLVSCPNCLTIWFAWKT